eukprot:3821801-Pleurochrysis_carterae.AAC.2
MCVCKRLCTCVCRRPFQEALKELQDPETQKRIKSMMEVRAANRTTAGNHRCLGTMRSGNIGNGMADWQQRPRHSAGREQRGRDRVGPTVQKAE